MKKTNFGSTPRAIALESLISLEKNDSFGNLLLDAQIKKYGLSGVDRAFYTALVYGVTERRMTLDYIIKKFSAIPFEKLTADVVGTLRLGLYQLLYMDRVPAFSAVTESVELVKKSSKSASGFVNALLRRAAGSKNRMLEMIDKAPMGVKYSLPEEIISIFRDSYGKEKTREICEAFLERTYISLRVNTLKTTREELAKKINADCDMPSDISSCITVKGPLSLSDFEPLTLGECFIQDRSSQRAINKLSPKPGSLLVDTCSCPGGKSFSSAICMENKGEIHSFDYHENKLKLVRDNAEKLGIDIIETAVHNGTSPMEKYIGKADYVICDVPCSGLGVIAGKPDIRYKDMKNAEKLPGKQAQILESASKYLKEGGRLLYSTCTLNSKENTEITDAFLLNHKEFARDGEPLTIFPSKYEDGFFIDILVKKA